MRAVWYYLSLPSPSPPLSPPSLPPFLLPPSLLPRPPSPLTTAIICSVVAMTILLGSLMPSLSSSSLRTLILERSWAATRFR